MLNLQVRCNEHIRFDEGDACRDEPMELLMLYGKLLLFLHFLLIFTQFRRMVDLIINMNI